MFLPLKQWGMEESCHDSSVVRTSQHVCIQFSLWFIYLHAMFITDNHEFFWSCNKHGICLSILFEIDSPFVCFVNAWGLHPRNGFVLLVWDSCIGFVWRLMHWQFFVSQIAQQVYFDSSAGKLIIIFPIPVIFVNFLFFNAAPHLRSFFVIFIMLSNITNCFVWYKIFSLFCVQIVSSRSRDTTPSFELFPFQQFHMHRSHCTRPSCHRFVSIKWC